MFKWMKKHPIIVSTICLLLIMLPLIVFLIYRQNDEDIANRKFLEQMSEVAERITYPELVMKMRNGEIDTIYYNTGKENMVATKKLDEERDITEDDCYVIYYPAGDDFRTTMLSFGVNLVLCKNANTSSIVSVILSGIFSICPLIIIIWFYLKLLQGPVNGVKDSEIIQKSDVKLDDIIGLDEIKDELNIIIKLISNPDSGRQLGAEIPHGILLSGPAGVGKTMIAKAISNAAGVPFISMNGSDFQEIYVGNGAKRIRELFAIARKNSPCIVFVDEFDAIGTKRDSFASTSEDTKTINALLKEMDGFTKLENVFVIAATNFPEKLDDSIKRSGRFDREITVNPPKDANVRLLMFKHYLKGKPLSDDVNLELLSKTVVGFTGADIATVCNEAALVAVAKDLPYITNDCLSEAVDKKIFKGLYSKDKGHEPDRKVVAYHEAGHAVMTMLCNQKVSRASIKSTTSGVGGVVFGQDSESQFVTQTELRNKIKIAYAGRIAEALTFPDVTTGASNDIQQATKILKSYVCSYGFNPNIGLLNLDTLYTEHIYSVDDITEQIIALSKEIYKEAYELLSNTDNYAMVKKLAEKLLEVEVLSGDEIVDFLKSET